MTLGFRNNPRSPLRIQASGPPDAELDFLTYGVLLGSVSQGTFPIELVWGSTDEDPPAVFVAVIVDGARDIGREAKGISCFGI